MVFQNYALYPHLSVAENIAFGLRLRKTPKSVIAERVTWAAKLLDLTPYLDRRPKELSGGQRQRVAMGRAIVRQPQVFLMDEPLSNLDAKLRVQMRADISKLQRDLGTTTIYVTHDQVEAMTMGDRVAVMSDGVLQQVDTPQRLYDQPANLFVAGVHRHAADEPARGGRVDRRHGGHADVAGQRLPLADEALRATRRFAARSDGASCSASAPDDLHLRRGPARPADPDRAARARRGARHRVDRLLPVDATAIRPEGVEEEVERRAESAEGVTATRPNLVASLPAREATYDLPLARRHPAGGRHRQAAPVRPGDR